MLVAKPPVPLAITAGLLLFPVLIGSHHPHRAFRVPEPDKLRIDQVKASPSGRYCLVNSVYQDYQKEPLPHSSALWSLDVSGGKPLLLCKEQFLHYDMDWQPGDRSALFTGRSQSIDAAAPLRTIDLRSQQLKTIASLPDGSYVDQPRWSRDGHWIAFNRRPFGRRSVSQPGAWLVKPDGSDMRRVPPPGGSSSCWFLGWRPDRPEYYLLAADAGLWIGDVRGRIRKVPVPFDQYSYLYVPLRGTHLAILPGTSTVKPETLTLHDLDGRGSRAIDQVLGGRWGAIEWSPDGRWIACSDHPQSGGDFSTRIHGVDGSRAAFSTGRGPAESWAWLDWSPDSRWCAAVLRPSFETQLYVVDVRKPKQNPTPVALRGGPCGWLSDGTFLCSDEAGLFAVNRAGSIRRRFPLDLFRYEGLQGVVRQRLIED